MMSYQHFTVSGRASQISSLRPRTRLQTRTLRLMTGDLRRSRARACGSAAKGMCWCADVGMRDRGSPDAQMWMCKHVWRNCPPWMSGCGVVGSGLCVVVRCGLVTWSVVRCVLLHAVACSQLSVVQRSERCCYCKSCCCCCAVRCVVHAVLCFCACMCVCACCIAMLHHAVPCTMLCRAV